MMNISADDLRSFASQILEAAGAAPPEAGVVAQSLVESNLVGHDSHGVMRVVEYVQQLRSGELTANAQLEILTETPALVAADAHRGFGQIQMTRLIERLAPKAAALGIACGTMRNCGHVGRLGEWVERIARNGQAALLTVNDNGVLQCVAPPGGIAPRISTNPLAIGVPTGDGPFSFDISTSAVANGKITVAHRAGGKCPPGWLQDADGKATTDPASRFSDPPGTILPMGGDQGYKGFGLGLMLDMLVGGLSGGSCPPADATAAMTNNVLLVIWNPTLFAGSSHFLAEADKLLAHVRSTPRKPDVAEIRLPGDRAAAIRKERVAHGISLDDGNWQALRALAEELGIDFEPSPNR
jgi:hydroxycarboxylate dehydrogenase B